MKKRQTRKSRRFSTTRMIALGFLCGIVIGTILLSLPIAAKSGVRTPLPDALFSATSALCVTGLSTVVMAEQWSLFGQVVLLLLIQFGGLGVVTFTTTILFLFGRRITLKERLLIQDAYNLNTLSGLVRMTIRIIKGTLLIEGVGAFLFAFRFVPEFGFLRGLWYAVFHAVSAFCNAGIDLIGANSFAPYQESVLINVTTMLLIIIGGIGFPVWWDLTKTVGQVRSERISWRRLPQKLSLHTKLVLVTTLVLIFGGAVLILLMEHSNPDTLGGLSPFQQVQASLFQSVTTRTAGFFTIPQQCFRHATAVVFIVWMFIGGSPSGTAGGVKTITVAVIFISVVSIIRGEESVNVFGRRLTVHHLRKALAVLVLSFTILIVMTMLLADSQNSTFLDTLYETTSAIATVGLTRGMTGELTLFGKWVIIICMYLGRIGPITLALALNTGSYRKQAEYPEGKLLIG